MVIITHITTWRHTRACPKLTGRYWRRQRRRLFLKIWLGVGLEIDHLLRLYLWWVGDKGPLAG